MDEIIIKKKQTVSSVMKKFNLNADELHDLLEQVFEALEQENSENTEGQI